MARINIPKPISTYKDLGTVELAKLARDQYISGFAAADQFSNSVFNMQSLEKDDHLKTNLSKKYTTMLDEFASRGDYETLGLAIHKGSSQFMRDYTPIKQSVTNRNEYQKSLQEAYEKGDINAGTYAGMLAMSDYGYQGLQTDETGNILGNSVYQGVNFYNDVNISEKIADRLKEMKPFIRQNLGTEIPYNEHMEITTADGDKGEPKFWVTTKSKTVQLPDNIIQMVVNDVMSEPDVQASLAQEIRLNTYQLDAINPETQQPAAMDYINKLIQSKKIKAEDVMPLVESQGPLVALQNVMFQDAVDRETQIAIGSFGGVRESSIGKTIKYDDIWKENEKQKIKNTKSIIDEDDVSYDVELFVKPSSTSYDNAVNNRKDLANQIKTNLALVTGHLNQNPNSEEFDETIFGSGGEGLDLENMTNSQILTNAEQQADAWRTATTNANTPLLKYSAWRNKFAPQQGKDESIEQYTGRLEETYNAYLNKTNTIIKAGQSYLINVAKANELSLENYNSTMHIISNIIQDYDIVDSKINNPIGLSIPNSTGYSNNMSYPEYVKVRGGQLNDAYIESGKYNTDFVLKGEDIVAGYNNMISDYPELEKAGYNKISNVSELPKDFFEGNVFESFAFAGNQNVGAIQLTQYIAGHINRKYGLSGDNMIGGIYQMPLGEYTWPYRDGGMPDNQQYYERAFHKWHEDLNVELTNLNNKFKSVYSDSKIPIQAAVITNFGAKHETSGIVNDQIKDFFKENVFPTNWAVRDAKGLTEAGWENAYINGPNNESNHFGYTVEYDVIENQAGVLNLSLGDDGPMIYVPIKITNSPPKGSGATDHKGKVYNMLVPTHYMDLPALTEYVNSPEMEVNTQWNKGVFAKMPSWKPPQYSNVEFIYGDINDPSDDKVVISGETHSKEIGLAKLVQNLINNRGGNR